MVTKGSLASQDAGNTSVGASQRSDVSISEGSADRSQIPVELGLGFIELAEPHAADMGREVLPR